MRVLMISDVYFPRVNGVSTSIQTFRRDLAALGCETWLVAPRYPQRGTTTSASCANRRATSPFDPEDRMMKPRATLAACRELAGARRRGARPDAVRRALDRTQDRARAAASRRSRRITRSSRNICTTTCRCCRPPPHARSRAASRAANATPSTPSSRRRSSSRTCSRLRRDAPDPYDSHGARVERVRRRRRRRFSRAPRHRGATAP